MNNLSRRSALASLLALAAGGVSFAACEESKKGGGAASASAAPKGSGAGPAAPSGRELKIAWSVWTGWMPFKLMEQNGFLAKRAKQHGVKIKLVEFKGYMDSVQAFTAKKVDGVAMTSMESLQPASSGIDSVAILVNDISNGGDGVLVRGDLQLKDLKGQTVLLEEFSVSHYLLVSALEKAGLEEKDVKIKNIPGDDAGKAFLTDETVKVVTTWNPYLFQATEQGKGKIIFSSKDIPGEIIDLLVVSGAALKEAPMLGNALVDAWYDAMRYLVDEKTKEDAIAIMAKGASASPEDFKKMLGGTDLYTDAKRCAAFLDGEQIKKTMAKVKQFSFDHDLIKDKGFEIGFGKASKAKLRFDSSYVRASQ